MVPAPRRRQGRLRSPGPSPCRVRRRSGLRPCTRGRDPSFPSTTAGGRRTSANRQPSLTTIVRWHPRSTAGPTGRVGPTASSTTMTATATVPSGWIVWCSGPSREAGRQRVRATVPPGMRGSPGPLCCAGRRTARSRPPTRPGWSSMRRPCTRRRSTERRPRSWPIRAGLGGGVPRRLPTGEARGRPVGGWHVVGRAAPGTGLGPPDRGRRAQEAVGCSRAPSGVEAIARQPGSSNRVATVSSS